MPSTLGKDTVKVQVFMKKALVQRLDEFADSLGISRSSAVNVAVNEYLSQKSTLQTMQTVIDEFQRLSNDQEEEENSSN